MSTKLLSVAGLILSIYAVWVEHKMETKDPDEEFSSLCDIEAIGASCSVVFTLPEGRLLSYFGLVPKEHFLDVPNAALGVVLYTYRLLLEKTFPPLTKILTVSAFASTVFLAYQLTFVLNDLCLLCWSIHVINTTIMYKMVKGGSSKVKTM